MRLTKKQIEQIVKDYTKRYTINGKYFGVDGDIDNAIFWIKKNNGYVERYDEENGFYHLIFNGKNLVMATKKQSQAIRCREAIKYLKTIIKEGDTLHTILRHVSSSGMTRHISILKGTMDITHYAAIALDDKRAKDGGIVCGGCGMDMGFNLVYRLGRVLYPNGSEKGTTARRNGNTTPETDGGYLLNQKWL